MNTPQNSTPAHNYTRDIRFLPLGQTLTTLKENSSYRLKYISYVPYVPPVLMSLSLNSNIPVNICKYFIVKYCYTIDFQTCKITPPPNLLTFIKQSRLCIYIFKHYICKSNEHILTFSHSSQGSLNSLQSSSVINSPTNYLFITKSFVNGFKEEKFVSAVGCIFDDAQAVSSDGRADSVHIG